MKCLLDYSLEQLTAKFCELGLEKYRALQVLTALYSGQKFSEITTIKKETRELLNKKFIDQPVSILKSFNSVDGTTKFLFKLADDKLIEGVLMKYKFGNTLCISSQVGCGMGCVFCASGLTGLERNLTSYEMLGQVIAVNRFLNGGLGEKRKITNIVLMGSGEPLINYDNVTKFINKLTDKNGFMFSERNITISTCGIVPKIKALADDGFKVNLSVSLHASNDNVRKTIMKIAQSYKISDLIDACKYYFEKTKRRITFEYTLIKGVNSSLEHAKELAKILQGINAQVNLIPLNEVEGVNLKTVERDYALKFKLELEKQGINATVRRTLGDDIEGACGQLRRRYLNDEINSES